MSAPVVFFWIFAALAVAGAVGTVANVRSSVAATASLFVTVLSLAGIFVLLGAPLVAVLQVLIHGGAMIALFAFVIAFEPTGRVTVRRSRRRWLQGAAAALILVAAAAVLRVVNVGAAPPPAPPGFGGHRDLGIALYTDYVLLVELVSLVLLAAVVGVVVLSQRESE